jgi:protocatechuate 3,4-dioxygenase beta subunit
VTGARVVVATGENLENRTTRRTDGNGRFRVVIPEVTEGYLLVQAAGLAPQQRAITVDRDLKSLEFEMAPSRILQGRVVDGDGNPVAGATVTLAAMGEASLLEWSTTSDLEGRFRCDVVPRSGHAFYATKSGYGAPSMHEVNNLPDGELVLRLEESFQITGRVVDAETGQPLPSFKVIPGRIWGAGEPDSMMYWETYREQQGRGGVYTMPFEDEGGSPFRLLVYADGYLPEMTPPLSGRGRRTNDFALRRGKGLEGVVVGPDGRPVEGAQVATLGLGYIMLSGPRIEIGGGERSAITTSDEQGRFRLPALLAAPTLVAVHEVGYGEINATNLEAIGKISLQKWGRVEGVMKFGTRPAADQEIALNSGMPSQLQYSHETFKTVTQSDGRFCFETVPPGQRQLVQLIQMNERSWMHSQPQTIDVCAGTVTDVVYGGKGRPITGKFVLEGANPEVEVEWNAGHHVLSSRMPRPPHEFKTAEDWRQWNGSAEVQEARKKMRTYGFRIEPDGSFRIEGVEAGFYTLQKHLQRPITDGLMGGPVIGHLSTEIEVPAMQGGVCDDPLELGELRLQAQRSSQ